MTNMVKNTLLDPKGKKSKDYAKKNCDKKKKCQKDHKSQGLTNHKSRIPMIFSLSKAKVRNTYTSTSIEST